MKNLIQFLFVALIIVNFNATAQVNSGSILLKLGNNPSTINSSAVLEMESTTKGILIPRMTTAQRTAIANPVAGLQVYDKTTNSNWYYNGTVWVEGATSATAEFINGTTGTDAVYTAGNVGIGTSTPQATLDVNGAIKVGNTTATPVAGMIRFNTTTNKFEGYDGTAWVEFH